MLKGFTLQEIVCFISIVLAVIFRMIMFKKVKKTTETKEGREYIADKGAKILVSLESGIFLSVLVFIIVSVFSLNIIFTIILQLIIWIFIVFIFKKFRR